MLGLFATDMFANQLPSAAWEANKSHHPGCQSKANLRIFSASRVVGTRGATGADSGRPLSFFAVGSRGSFK